METEILIAYTFHMLRNVRLRLIFIQRFKNVKIILSLQAIFKKTGSRLDLAHGP